MIKRYLTNIPCVFDLRGYPKESLMSVRGTLTDEDMARVMIEQGMIPVWEYEEGETIELF